MSSSSPSTMLITLPPPVAPRGISPVQLVSFPCDDGWGRVVPRLRLLATAHALFYAKVLVEDEFVDFRSFLRDNYEYMAGYSDDPLPLDFLIAEATYYGLTLYRWRMSTAVPPVVAAAPHARDVRVAPSGLAGAVDRWSWWDRQS